MLKVYEFHNESSLIHHLDDLHAIWSDELPFWSVGEIRASLNQHGGISTRCFYLASQKTDAWQGFCLLQDNIQSIELLYIYCLEDIRHKNIAKGLLMDSLAALSRPNADVILEVRASNTNAQKFYEKIGFTKIGMRRKYYANAENAFTYKWIRSDQNNRPT